MINPNPNTTRNKWHLVAARLNHPLVAGGFLAVAIWCIDQGIDESVWVPVIFFTHFIVVIVLEQITPRNPDMNLFRDRQSLHDVAFNFMIAVMRPFAESVLVLMVAWLSEYRLGAGLTILWPWQWHFGLQAVLAVLSITFMDYWQHRMFHSVNSLWWFHALHHNATQMHVLKTARIHFVDGMIGALVVPLPLILLGAPKEIVLIANLWMVLMGRSVHANADQRFPAWYHYVLPTVQVHNLHHSNERSLQDSNYSTNLPLWDWLFGTLSHPNKYRSDRMGIKSDYVSGNFFRQLYQPFVWVFKSPKGDVRSSERR